VICSPRFGVWPDPTLVDLAAVRSSILMSKLNTRCSSLLSEQNCAMVIVCTVDVVCRLACLIRAQAYCMWVLTALDVFEDPLTPELRVDLGYLLAMRMIRCMTRIQSEAQEVDNVDSAWFCRSGKDVCSGWRLRRSGVALEAPASSMGSRWVTFMKLLETVRKFQPMSMQHRVCGYMSASVNQKPEIR
jgi:hypothetical protein